LVDKVITDWLGPPVEDTLRGRANMSLVEDTASPDEAARTLNNAVKSGIPFSVGNADPKNFNEEIEGRSNRDIAEANPAVQRYLANNDFAAAVSKDDLGTLHQLSQSLMRVSGHDVFHAAAEGFKEGFGEGEIGLTHEDIQKYPSWLVFQPLSVALGTFMRGFQGTIRGAAEGAREFLRETGANEAWAARFGRDLEVELTRQVFQHRDLHPAAAEMARTIQPSIQPYIQAGEVPQPGVHPLTDEVLIDQAKRDAENLKDVQSVAIESKTLERSPEAFKKFIDEIAPDRVIGVSVDAIKEGFGDRAPAAFEWLPDFERKFNRADASGGDVEIPLKDWLAAIKDRPELAQALKDDIRVREGGLTTREADALKETKPEAYQPSETTEDVAKKELWLNPLFKDAKSAGMTEGEFASYSKKLEQRDTEAHERAVADEARRLKMRATAEWTNHELDIRNEVTTDLRSRPDILADEFFRTGRIGDTTTATFKLDANAIEARYGKDVLDSLPDRSVARRGGVDPNDAADLFGFRGGEALVNNLALLENARRTAKQTPGAYFNALVEKATSERMEAKYGVLKDNILAEAREAVGSGGQANLLAEEMFALMRQVPELKDVTPISRDDIRARVKEAFNQDLATSARKVANYVRDVGKAGRQAELALLKGDIPAAFQAKGRQFLAFTLMREAQAFAKEAAKADALIRRYAKSETLDAVDQAHTNQVHQILDNIGIGNKHPLPEDMPSLESFVRESEGQLAVAPWLGEKTKPIKEMTVEEFRAVGKSLQSLDHVGRAQKVIETVHGRADLDNVIHDIKAQQERFDLVHQPLNKSVPQRIKAFGRWITGAHVLMERILDYSDKFDHNGPLTRWLDRPLRDSTSKEIQLNEGVVRKMREIQPYTDSAVHDIIENRVLPDALSRDGFLNLNRGNLRQLMLHMGNESNIDKVVRGFQPPKAEAIDTLRFRADLWDLVHKNATEKDWKWVQGMWDIYAGIKKEADAMQLRDTGVPVDHIDPIPVPTKFGTFSGGYAPLVYDRARSNIEADIAKKATFDANYQWATTPHGYTVPRTKYAAPLDLTGALLGVKLQGMVHDIAFREAIRNAGKLIYNKDFQLEMTQKWGKEISTLFQGWLKDVANVHNVDDSYAQGAARFFATMRQNIVSTLIFVNPGTYMKHGGTAAAMSAERVGAKALASAAKELGVTNVLQSARDLVRSPIRPEADLDFVQSLKDVTDPSERGERQRQFVLDNSAFMRKRQMSFQDTIRESYERASEAGLFRFYLNARDTSMRIGRFPVALSDAVSAMPTWLAAYNKAFREGAEHTDAVFVADKEVSRAHGSTISMDQPRVMRTGEAMRWVTPLYNFWGHMFNNQLQFLWDAGAVLKGRDEPRANVKSLASRFFYLAVLPIAIEEMASPVFDKNHESLGERTLKATIRYLGAGIIGLRDLTNSIYSGYEPSVGLLGTAMKAVYNTAQDVYKTGLRKNVSNNMITHSFTALGMATGLGGAQIGKTVQGLTHYEQGTERPRTFDEWRQMLRTGSAKEKK
jgi:hypothetical protein